MWIFVGGETAMDNLKILPQEQVLRLVAQADPREFTLFLGAGASRSSGVILASEMIKEWRELAFREQAGDEDFESWCERQPWFRSPTEYSDLFESVYPDERARQIYIEPKIEAAFPGWGYLYLANIVRSGRFNVILTTNFDDLVNEALTRFLGYNPVVCAADSEAATINVSTARAKIVKLHGDYLFKSLKNTKSELERLTKNMERKFKEFAGQCGMLVLGYAGADNSIMSLLAKLLAQRDSFPNGIYWGIHDTAGSRPDALITLTKRHPTRLRLFACEDFDIFMAGLHEKLDLTAPMTIIEPLKTARLSFDRLVERTTLDLRANETIGAHFAHLVQELGGPIAQVAEADVLDFLEAEIALGVRDYATALERIERYVDRHEGDARALSLWGAALMIKSEEEGGDELVAQAAAKWREAVGADPAWPASRYNLMRFHAMRQEFPDAIKQGEALLELAPKDRILRMNLAQLYASSGRTRDGLQLIDGLLDEDDDNAMLHMMRGALLEQRGLMPEALAEVSRAVSIAPANSWARSQSAHLHWRAGRPREAGAEFNQAVQIDRRNVYLRIQAASFFLAANQPLQAKQHLDEAARLEPKSAEVRGWLATAHLASGSPDEARREIEVALEIDPRDSRLLTTAGQIYGALNQPQVAEAHLLRATEQNPFAVGPYAVLAQFYAYYQRWPEHQATIQRITQIDPVMGQQMQQYFAQQKLAAPVANAARRLFNWLGVDK